MPRSNDQPVNNRSDLLKFPKSYAFVIGINHYPLINASLVSAVPDARAIAKVLKEKQGFDHIELMLGMDPAVPQETLGEGLNEVDIIFDAKGQTIRDLLQRIKDPQQEPQITPKDCIVFYYAGHGKAGEFDQGPAGYLLPSDARPQNALLENDSLIPMEAVFDALKSLDCHHTLLILDCCFAGKFRYIGTKTRDVEETFFMPMYEERFERFKRERAWQVLVSAGPDQTAADWMGDRTGPGEGVHSPFAEALIEALQGKAEIKPAGKNLGDGVLTSQELFIYLWNKVENITKENPDFHIQYPDLFPMGEHKGGQFIFFDPENKLNFADRVLRNPYKGLKPFEPEDADLFFGRKEVIKDLLAKIKKTDILVITSPSGGGKSSVAKAGLFPAMQEAQSQEGKKEWPDLELMTMRPGAHPMAQLEPIGDQIDPAKNQLLLIDQYEELFTECKDLKERQFFEKELIGLHELSGEGKLKIILTLRSDFEWQLEASDFGKAFWDPKIIYTFLFRLPPMSLDELREALVAPAWVEAYDFAGDDLVDFILQEISYAPGALPMLSFTMSELYRITTDEDNRTFTFGKYKDQLGGVNGALSTQAGTVFNELPDDGHRSIMKNILLRMVQLNDGSYSGRRVFLGNQVSRAFNELDYLNDEDDEMVLEVIKRLETALLILKGRDSKGNAFIEPVHDALINFWPQCRQWIEDFGRENLILQRQLWQAVLDKDKNDDDNEQDEFEMMRKAVEIDPELLEPEDVLISTSALWDNSPKLFQVLNQVKFAEADVQNRFSVITDGFKEKDETYFSELFAPYSEEELEQVFLRAEHWLNQSEVEFVIDSWNRKEDRIKKLTEERDAAIKAKELAESKTLQAEALSITTVARNLPDRELPNILRLMQAAYAKTLPASPLPLVAQTLAENFYKQFGEEGIIYPLYKTNLTPHKIHKVNTACFSSDGQSIITACGDHVARTWNLEGKQLVQFGKHKYGNVLSFALFSPDDQFVITCPVNGSSSLWDKNGELISTLQEHTFAGEYALFCPSTTHKSETVNNDQLFLTYRGRKLTVWNTNGAIISNKIEHAGKINTAVFSSDGTYILTASMDKTAKLWRLNGDLVKDLNLHKKTVYAAAFSPDDQQILTASQDKTVKLWNLEGKVIHAFPEQETIVSKAFFSPDGQQVMIYSYNNLAKIMTLNGQLKSDLSDSFKEHHSPAFSPDGKHILAIGKDHRIKIWDLNGRLLTILGNHKKKINTAVFSPDSKFVLSASDDETAKRWELRGNLVANLLGKAGKVEKVAFSPDGKFILTSHDKKVKLWTTNGTLIADLGDQDYETERVHFSPDGKYVAVSFVYQASKLWTTKGEFINQMEYARKIDYSPDGKFILLRGYGMTAHLHDSKGRPIAHLEEHTHNINSAVFSLDGKTILTGASDKTAMLWDTQGKLIKTLKGHSREVREAKYMPVKLETTDSSYPDGEVILTRSNDHTLKLWNNQGLNTATLDKHRAKIIAADFSPDGQLILSTSEDKTVKLWNIDGELIAGFSGFGPYIKAAKFSPIGEVILARDTKIAKVWDKTGKFLFDLTTYVEQGFNRPVRTPCIFSPDGTYILNLADRDAHLWSVKGAHLAELKKHTGMIRKAVFSSDGQYILTTSDDHTAKLWNLKGELLADLNKHTAGLIDAAFSADGQFMITHSSDKTVKVWPTPAKIFQYLSEESAIPELTGAQLENYGLLEILKPKTDEQT